MGRDTSLGVHDDNSEVSINVALTDTDSYSGGQLALYHRARCDHPQREKLAEPYLHCKDIGTMLVYPGDVLHQVMPLERGACTSLIIWLKSDTYRLQHGCPLCKQTDRLLYA